MPADKHPAPWKWDEFEGLVDANGADVIDYDGGGGIAYGPASEYVRVVIESAPELEAALRRLEFGSFTRSGLKFCQECEDVDMHVPGCSIGDLLARLDTARAKGET